MRHAAATIARLEHGVGLGVPPCGLTLRRTQGLAVLAATLVGLGLVFWVAARWDTLGHMGRFALLQGVMLVVALGVWGRACWLALLC